MADFLTPPANKPAEIGFTLENMQASQAKAYEVLQKSMPKIEASAKTLEILTTTAAKEIDKSYQTIDHALTRQRNNSMNPKIWNDIVGFFDSDYNDDYQRAQVDIEVSKLNQTATSLQTAEAVHSSLINTVGQQIAAAEKGAAIVKEGILAPLEVEGRKLANASLGQQLQMGQLQLTAARRDEFFGAVSDDQLLGMSEGRFELPEGVSPNHVKIELLRRTQIEQQVKMAQFEFNAGNNKAGDEALNAALGKFSAAEIAKMQEQAAANGGLFELAPGVITNSFQLARLHTRALALEREEDTALAALITTSAEAESAALANEQQASLLITETGGNVDPAFKGLMAAYNEKLTAFTTLIEQGSVSQSSGASLMAAEITKMSAAVKAEQDRILASTPKEKKGAKAEFLQTGAVLDLNNAASFIVDEATNPYAMHTNVFFKDAWSLLSKNMLTQLQDQANATKKISLKALNVGETADEITTSKEGKLDPTAQARKALTTPDEANRTPLELVSGIGAQWVMEESFKKLVEAEQHIPLANRYWSKFYNANSKTYDNSFYDENGNFSIENVFARMTAEDVKLGKTMGVTHTQQLIDAMGSNTVIESYMKEVMATPDTKTAAFITLLGGREALYIGINDAVNQIGQFGLHSMRQAVGANIPGGDTAVGGMLKERAMVNFGIYNDIVGSVERAAKPAGVQ